MGHCLYPSDLLQQVKALSPEQQLPFLKQQLASMVDGSQRELIETAVMLGFEMGRNIVPQKQVVILIHGIRTNAAWQDRVEIELSHVPNTDVYPIGYGRLDAVRFWCPVITRRKPIERVLREIRGIISNNPTANITVVAHSFGTYIISRILASHSDIKINRLLLCGSIIPEDYGWDMIPKLPGVVLNDVGTDDIWPVAAEATSWGFGTSGTFGFKKHCVKDRYHKLGHSDFFTIDHIRKFWLPFITIGQIVPSAWGAERPPIPPRLYYLSITPVKTLFPIIIGSLGWLANIAYRYFFAWK